MSPRPQIDHIRRPQLLAAAAEVIAERGVAATRIADVAERAGTSASGVLYWFESRDELLAEALTFAEDAFYDELAAALAGLDGPARAARCALIEPRSAATTGPCGWSSGRGRCATRRCAAARQQLDDRWRAQIARDRSPTGSRAGELRRPATPTGRRSSWRR